MEEFNADFSVEEAYPAYAKFLDTSQNSDGEKMQLHEQVAAIIDYLESVRVRPAMFIGEYDGDRMEVVLHFFNSGLGLGGFTLKAAPNEREPSRLKSWEKHGIGVGSTQSPAGKMRDKGKSEKEITDVLLEIEVEYWRDVLAWVQETQN